MLLLLTEDEEDAAEAVDASEARTDGGAGAGAGGGGGGNSDGVAADDGRLSLGLAAPPEGTDGAPRWF